MTDSEYYTWQFYTWEYRGRGLHREGFRVQLEPPFIPFYRHLPRRSIIDDGKRHTWVSQVLEAFKRSPKPLRTEESVLNYEELEPFPDEQRDDNIVFKLYFSKERSNIPDTIKTLLSILSSTHQPISFEVFGNSETITVQFVCSALDAYIMQSILTAYLPTITIQQDEQGIEAILKPDTLTTIFPFALAEEFIRPLATYHQREIDPLTAIVGLLDSITGTEQLGIQILFQGCVNQWGDSIVRSATMYDGKSFFLDAPEAPKLSQEKIESQLFAVSIRGFVQADNDHTRQTLAKNLIHTISLASHSPYNRLVPVVEEEMQEALQDIYARASHRTGMLLNVEELATLVHIPSTAIQSKKFTTSTRKTKAVPAIAKNKAFTLGLNYHNQIENTVTIGIDERLKHTHIIGATGTGKSTLIANLILQDISNSIGITLLDPHGDLVDDIIARVPAHRMQDIVLIDPTDIAFPIGLNILEAHNDIEKEILSSDLVASFRKFATSWGDQMNTVLGNAIIAILESKRGGTMNDLRRFLIEQDFRNEILNTVSDLSIVYYWKKEYPLQKSNSVGSILTRLDTFLRPKVIRNMLVQKRGLDFEQLLNTNKIILIKLPQGMMGKENSYLLGSLIVSKLHQAAFARQQLQTRSPYFIYIDEFQNFITPSITEMLSGVRKYNVGLILSHQDLQQLQREDAELINSVLGNIYTRIVFRMGEPDAKKLQDGFSGFDYTDLQNLGRGEAVVRVEQPQYDTSLDTTPLTLVADDEKDLMKQQILSFSRNKYATPREVVEQELFDSLDFTATEKKTQKRTVTQKNVAEDSEEAVVTEKQQEIEILDIKNAGLNNTKIIPTTPIQQGVLPPQTALEESIKERDNTHRYLQTLVKKMAESKEYVATIEAAIPNGQVDVLLTKESKTIAIEISNTTDAEWEVHNIGKCIAAKFDVIISLSGDVKQLDKIKKKCAISIDNFDSHSIHFFTPDLLFEYLNQQPIVSTPEAQQTTIKGYRVNVTYDAVTQEEMKRKRASVAQVVMSSLRKKKK